MQPVQAAPDLLHLLRFIGLPIHFNGGGLIDLREKTQIWIAVSAYVLVAIVRKRLGLEARLCQILQMLSVTLFEKTPILPPLQASDFDNDLGDLAKAGIPAKAPGSRRLSLQRMVRAAPGVPPHARWRIITRHGDQGTHDDSHQDF